MEEIVGYTLYYSDHISKSFDRIGYFMCRKLQPAKLSFKVVNERSREYPEDQGAHISQNVYTADQWVRPSMEKIWDAWLPLRQLFIDIRQASNSFNYLGTNRNSYNGISGEIKNREDSARKIYAMTRLGL